MEFVKTRNITLNLFCVRIMPRFGPRIFSEILISFNTPNIATDTFKIKSRYIRALAPTCNAFVYILG